MEFEFDDSGYLKPYKIISFDLETFEDVFVVNFRNSITREKLFANYHLFLDEFRNTIIETNFVQWINGSFVTKKLNPQDIDIVILIDNKLYESKEKVLTHFQSVEFYQKTKIDCYFLRLYAEDDVKYVRTESDFAYWSQQFFFC